MDTGHFYFLSDQYFIDFPDSNLMQNKETINGQSHGRPCFYAFQDMNTGLFWVIPISSQVYKYTAIYNNKIQRHGKCDTIVFGDVVGHRKAFLIQNMCPVTPKYIINEYCYRATNIPVSVDGILEKELVLKAKKVLALQRNGHNLIFPDVIKIEKELLIQWIVNII